MNILKMILRLLRRCLMWIFVAYWVIFIFYSFEELITGGSSAVVEWYKHIGSSLVHRGDGWFLTPWSWGEFLAQQVAILAITLGLYFFERRYAKHRRVEHP